MDTLFLFVLFGCVWSAGGQAELRKLSEGYRAGVELALEQINTLQGVQQHFLFFKSVKQSEVDVGFGSKYLSHHFFLKATRCARGTAPDELSKCTFRNDRPLIDCWTCYKTFNDVIQEQPNPYIHCVHKPAVTKDMQTTRRDHCEKMSYSSGSVTLLGVKKPNS